MTGPKSVWGSGTDSGMRLYSYIM